MTKISDEQLLRLWRAGVYVGQSWETYAQPDLKARWYALKEESAIDAFSQGMQQAATSEAEPFEKFDQAFAGTRDILTKRSKLMDELKKNILGYIAKGYLHGFGYELPRSMADTPVAIPKSAWSGRVGWDKNTLSYQGVELCAVRLTTNRIRNEILDRGHVTSTPSAKARGRPSIGPDIEAAFHALNSTGDIDPNKWAKSHFDKVRKWLELNRPNLMVPAASISSEAIRSHFSPLFRDLKKNRKQ